MDWLEIKEFLKDTFKVVFFIVIVLFFIQYVFSVTTVVGDSMNPTLHNEEYLFLNKLKYRISDIKRGDVISLKYENTKYLIKRVIGLPGDTVLIQNNHVYINGTMYEESYLSSDLEYDDFSLSSLGYDKIPEDMYFVLGDNRSNSMDSREIGLISRDDVIGEIVFRFWPLNRFKFVS